VNLFEFIQLSRITSRKQYEVVPLFINFVVSYIYIYMYIYMYIHVYAPFGLSISSVFSFMYFASETVQRILIDFCIRSSALNFVGEKCRRTLVIKYFIIYSFVLNVFRCSAYLTKHKGK
jgi:hypothetical protein